MNKIIRKINGYRRLIVVKHTIFSVGISLIAMCVAGEGRPSIYVVSWLLVAIIGAVIGGSATNAVVDMEVYKEEDIYDRKIPTGLINKQEGILLASIGYSIMVLASKMISDLCLVLSPIAIILLIAYANLKKITWTRHFILGIVSASAPIGVCIAITGKITILPISFGIINMLWISASDIMYSIRRYDFNIKNGIHSFATSFGIEKSIAISVVIYTVALSILADIVVMAERLGLVCYVVISIFILISYSSNGTIVYKKK